MIYIGIDVGDNESGYCICDKEYKIYDSGKVKNESLLEIITMYDDPFAIIEDYVLRGKARVHARGTVEWIGRYKQFCEDNDIEWVCYTPQKYRSFLCNSSTHTDSKIKDFLDIRFGEKFLKDNHFIGRYATTDVRSALALCVYYIDFVVC